MSLKIFIQIFVLIAPITSYNLSESFSNPNYKSASLKTASILYEYMDPRVSKTNGLKEVMKLHGISMADLCSFGDADNDYDMTLNAGVGVVMENGSDKTKSVADYICDDNDSDGIGKFIEEYILRGMFPSEWVERCETS